MEVGVEVVGTRVGLGVDVPGSFGVRAGGVGVGAGETAGDGVGSSAAAGAFSSGSSTAAGGGREGAGGASDGGAALGASGGAAGCGAPWATAIATRSGAKPFISAGGYASFAAMASAPRDAWGDLATTAFVESSILFKSLDPDARRDLLQLAQLASFAPGEIVSGESDEGFYLVRDGSAAVMVVGPGGPVEITRLEHGALFGEGRVLGAGHRAWLAAVSDVTVVAFPAPVIAAMATRFPKVRKLLEAVHAAREKEAAGKLVS